MSFIARAIDELSAKRSAVFENRRQQEIAGEQLFAAISYAKDLYVLNGAKISQCGTANQIGCIEGWNRDGNFFRDFVFSASNRKEMDTAKKRYQGHNGPLNTITVEHNGIDVHPYTELMCPMKDQKGESFEKLFYIEHQYLDSKVEMVTDLEQ